MKIRVLHILTFLFASFCFQKGNSQVIEVSPDLISENISSHIEYWADNDCTTPVDFVFQKKDSLNFQEYQDSFFSYPNSNSCPWIYFQLVNTSNENLNFNLRLDNHKLSRIRWHTFRKDKAIDAITTGDDFSYSQRPIQHLNYLIPIEMQAADTLDCYLFLYRGTNIIYTNIYIESLDDFIGYSAIENYKMGILIGISIIFVFISFVIFLIFRTPLLFTYFLMVLSMFVFSITVEGIGFQYVWGDSGKFAARFFAIGIPLVQIVSFMSFGILYFKTKQLHPKVHKVLLGLFVMIGVLIFGGIPIMLVFRDTFFYYKVITRILIYFLEGIIISAFLVILLLAFQEFRKNKDKELIAFIAVITVYLFFLLAFFLETLGFLWVTKFLEYSLFPSFIFEMIVLTFIMFRNYRKELNEKEKLEIAYNQNQVKIVNALLEGEELERQRIASDLHDSLGSLLSISKLHLSQVNFAHKDEVEILIEKAHTETRQLSNALMPKSLFTLGLVVAIQDLCEWLEKMNHVKVLLVKNDFVFSYSDFQKINFYRLVNELLDLAIIESKATEITIHLTEFDEELNLIIEDNGNGKLTNAFFENEKRKNTLTRIEALRGEFHIDSTAGRGTNIVIDFQLQEAFSKKS